MDGITMIQLDLTGIISIYINHGKITIPNHKGDIKKGTLNSILKQAGLK